MADYPYTAALIVIGTIIMGGILISTIVLFTLFIVRVDINRNKILKKNIKIYVCILSLSLLRTIWWPLNARDDGLNDEVEIFRSCLNRLSFIPLYLECSFYSASWLSIILSVVASPKIPKIVHWTMFAIDLCVVILIVIGVLMKVVDEVHIFHNCFETQDCSRYPDFSDEICSYCCLLIAIMFLIIGIKALVTVKNILPNFKSIVILFAVISVLFVCVSIMRWIFMNIYRWSTSYGNTSAIRFSDPLFASFAYLVPDLIPTIIILYCLTTASAGYKKQTAARKENETNNTNELTTATTRLV